MVLPCEEGCSACQSDPLVSSALLVLCGKRTQGCLPLPSSHSHLACDWKPGLNG